MTAVSFKDGIEFEAEATALMNQLDSTMYGVKRTIVNGVRTMAAAFTILSG